MRRHLSCDDCLEDNADDYQNFTAVLYTTIIHNYKQKEQFFLVNYRQLVFKLAHLVV